MATMKGVFMSNEHESCTCRFCDASGLVRDFDVSTDSKGFWCPDCDGYTYLDPSDDNRRMLLLLEDRQIVPTVIPSHEHLRKRLSPLRYPGGKSKVIDQIYPRLRQTRMSTFVELFAGGASLGLSLLDAGKIKHLVLNDMDPLVYNFWWVVLHRPNELIERIKLRLPTISDFWFMRKLLEEFSCGNAGEFYQMDAAYGFLLLNRTSFGGIYNSNPLCGKSGSDEQFRQRWNSEMLAARIGHIGRTLAPHISLYHEDAVELMSNVVGWMPSDTTVFVDPPYTKAGQKLYRHGFEDGHEYLADVLNAFFCNYPGSDIVITYNDCPMIRDLYPYAAVDKLQTCWTISRQ